MINNQDELEHDDMNPLIRQSLIHQIHIWHDIGANGKFTSLWSLDRVISFLEGRSRLVGAYKMEYVHENAVPYIHYFKQPFSFNGISPDLLYKALIIPTGIKDKVIGFADKYNLSGYLDLIWYLLIRLQVLYTIRIGFGIDSNKEHTEAIRKSKEDVDEFKRLVQYSLDLKKGKTPEPLSITIKQGIHSHTISDSFTIMMLVDCYIAEFLTDENGKLLKNWRGKIASFESSHDLKRNLEYIHLDFSMSFIAFLKGESIVTDTKLSAQYLKPIARLLNLSKYPFMNNGADVTIRHIRSVLTNAEYALPKE